jgi:hypothetical protein
MADNTQPGEGLSDQQQEAVTQIGKMMSPQTTGFDDRVQAMHDEAHAGEHASTDYEKEFAHFPHEASAAKMRAAAEGGAGELGPSEMEQQAIKQRSALQAQEVTQSAAKAQQAQAAQVPDQPPPAPTGPAGVTQPYPAQKSPQGPSDVTPMPPA